MASDNDILFSEKQQFRQWWIWLLLVCLNAPFVAGVIKQIGWGQPFGDDPMTNTQLICAASTVALLTIFILSIRLETQIKPDGIYVQFYPFHFSYRYYPWNALRKSYVRQYSPIGEYGGWGLRLGAFGHGKAFNISGSKGLQLEFTNGERLLIGTNKPEELNTVLAGIGQLKQ
ncbi:hypothetical protein [Niastella sp. OAS944]|uniref:hypothetical protein n=1 Tax=Niastella sp. OAS944 TaxID=2664089 RepID=UPI00346D5FF7|nr:hypothetical protein [Chitinophagaceae bacterium OAS944]